MDFVIGQWTVILICPTGQWIFYGNLNTEVYVLLDKLKIPYKFIWPKAIFQADLMKWKLQ